MSQSSDDDQEEEEVTIDEFAAVTLVPSAAEAAASVLAEEPNPADDEIPAGAEAGYAEGGDPGHVSREITGPGPPTTAPVPDGSGIAFAT